MFMSLADGDVICLRTWVAGECLPSYLMRVETWLFLPIDVKLENL